jgi:hypothetical protein
MRSIEGKRTRLKLVIASVTSLGLGLLVGTMSNEGQAGIEPPTEHKGVGVTALGVLPEASLEKQIGLCGYVLQLR